MAEIRNKLDWVSDLLRTGARRVANAEKAIGYIGWAIGGNLGDEAMYEAAQGLFDGRSVEIFAGARREALLATFGLSGRAKFERVFLGGGTLINHGYLPVVQRALDLGVPVSTLGTGVGSSGFGTAEAPLDDGWRDALNAMERIGVRGPRSAAKLRSKGVERVDIIGDLALALTPDAPIDLSKADGFLLNAARPSDPTREADVTQISFEALVAATCALAATGLKPLPVAFCKEDVEPIQEVLSRAGLETLSIEEPATSTDFFQLAPHARLTVGVRLHAAVLSACVGVPPLCIAYREKGHDFAESLDAPEIMVDPHALKPSQYAERAVAVAQNSGAIGAQLHAIAFQRRKSILEFVHHA